MQKFYFEIMLYSQVTGTIMLYMYVYIFYRDTIQSHSPYEYLLKMIPTIMHKSELWRAHFTFIKYASLFALGIETILSISLFLSKRYDWSLQYPSFSRIKDLYFSIIKEGVTIYPFPENKVETVYNFPPGSFLTSEILSSNLQWVPVYKEKWSNTIRIPLCS